MSTLFILSHAPHTDPGESGKLDLAREGDAVVLIEDAVYGAGAAVTPLAGPLAELPDRGVEVCVLGPDLQARGVETELPTVDYGGLVDLIATHDRSVH